MLLSIDTFLDGRGGVGEVKGVGVGFEAVSGNDDCHRRNLFLPFHSKGISPPMGRQQ